MESMPGGGGRNAGKFSASPSAIEPDAVAIERPGGTRLTREPVRRSHEGFVMGVEEEVECQCHEFAPYCTGKQKSTY